MPLQRTKFVIYLLLAILILGTLGFFLWQYLAPTDPADTDKPTGSDPVSGTIPNFPDTSGNKDQDGGNNTNGDTNGTAGEKNAQINRPLIQLTNFPIIGASLNDSRDAILFYKKDGGDFFSSNFDGTLQEKLSNITIVGITEVFWSPERDRRAVFYLDEETLKGFLHIGTSSVAVLPTNIRSFSWSPRGSLLSYLIEKENALDLVTAASSGKNQQTLTTTPIRDAQMQWVTTDTIALQTAPSGTADGFLFALSRSSGRIAKLLGPHKGLSSLWSPDGSYMLVSTTQNNGRGLALAIYNQAGEEMFRTGLATLPQKCIWTKPKVVFCAVPRNETASVVWPDEYLRGSIHTTDRLVRIDLEREEIRELFNDEGRNFDMTELVVTDDESHVFFTNRIDGTLWRLKLK